MSEHGMPLEASEWMKTRKAFTCTVNENSLDKYGSKKWGGSLKNDREKIDRLALGERRSEINNLIAGGILRF